MKDKETYPETPQFRDFVLKEFNATVGHATLEELSEFAFGSLREAKKAFNKYREL